MTSVMGRGGGAAGVRVPLRTPLSAPGRFEEAARALMQHTCAPWKPEEIYDIGGRCPALQLADHYAVRASFDIDPDRFDFFPDLHTALLRALDLVHSPWAFVAIYCLADEGPRFGVLYLTIAAFPDDRDTAGRGPLDPRHPLDRLLLPITRAHRHIRLAQLRGMIEQTEQWRYVLVSQESVFVLRDGELVSRYLVEILHSREHFVALYDCGDGRHAWRCELTLTMSGTDPISQRFDGAEIRVG